MSRQTNQRWLPDGFEIVAELAAKEAIGHVFKVLDRRASGQQPSLRVVRLLDIGGAGADEWSSKVRERVELLLGLSLPYVACPREIGVMADGLFLVDDFYPHSLAERIQTDEGLDPEQAEPLLDQLLAGLAALHDRGICHGDLRPENIFLQATDSQCLLVWIGDASIGGLAAWSGGAILDKESRFYALPEWQGEPREPTEKADLHALGLSMCEALLGRRGNPQRHPLANDKKLSRDKVRKLLRQSTASAAVKKMVCSLLSENSVSFHNAGEARREFRILQNALWGFRNPRRAAVYGLGLAAICVIALVGYALGLRGNQTRIRDPEKSPAENAEQFAKAGLELEVVTRERDKYKADLDACMPKLPPNSDPQVQEAMKLWKTANDENSDLNLGRAQSIYEDQLRKEKSVPQTDQKRPSDYLKDWLTRATRLLDKSAVWPATTQYSADRAMFRRAMQSPWTDDFAAAEARADDLNAAARLWVKLSDKSDWTWQEVNEFVGNEDGLSDGARKQIRGWLNRIREQGEWKLQPIAGIAPEGSGTARVIVLSSLTSEGYHEWSRETSHKYAISDFYIFTWKPCDRINLSLDGERTAWRLWTDRPALIDEKSFEGPLAIWKLNQAGEVSTDGANLSFSIVNCPGPPPKWGINPIKRAASKILGQADSKNSNTGSN